MFDNNSYDLQRARHDEFRRVAEEARHQQDILAQTGQDETEPQPFYANSLAKIGEWMVEVGENLQVRYGELQTEPSVNASGGPSTVGC